MWISAAFDRWQPGIASLVPLSAYAVDPSASTFDELSLVLPAQRPASPEIAESPTLTTVGVPTPGPSAIAGDDRLAAQSAPRTTAQYLMTPPPSQFPCAAGEPIRARWAS